MTADARRDLAERTRFIVFSGGPRVGQLIGDADGWWRIERVVGPVYNLIVGEYEVVLRPATGGSDGPGWGATAVDIDGDAVRYTVGG